MIPASFEYEKATSLDHALRLLLDGGWGAMPIAGGHSLLPMMRLRLARPDLLVDIGGLGELRGVEESDEGLTIGALTTHHALAESDLVTEACPLVACVAAEIGDPQVRHRGTIGGSVAHADPASDFPSTLLALDATMILTGSDGERAVPAKDFFIGPFESDKQQGELLTAIRVPKRVGWGCAYEKFQRRAQDWAIVGVAAVVKTDDGAVSEAGIGLTNFSAVPVRATVVEEALVGAQDSAAVAAAAALVSEAGPAMEDENASSEYRMHLTEVLIRRAVVTAMGGD